MNLNKDRLFQKKNLIMLKLKDIKAKKNDFNN